MAELTEENIRAFIKVLDETEVPQHGRFIAYRGVIYGEGDEFPEDLRDLMEKITSG